MPEIGTKVRPLRDADWPALCALDMAAFGAPREFLLRNFASRLPSAAHVAEEPGGRLTGFALARDGLRAPQIGPVVAAEAAAARALLAAALAALPAPSTAGDDASFAVVDLCDTQAETAAWIAAQGAREQRPFTRIALGADPPCDPASSLVAVAGPEFG